MNPLTILIGLKLQIVSNIFRKMRSHARLELLTLLLFLIAAGTGLFFLFYHSFHFFEQQKPFGSILIDECFYLFNFMIFVMLLISSGISAYASLYKSPEIAFLIARNIRWKDVYFLKILETLWISAWPILFLITPFIAAFTMTRGIAASFFPFFCFVFYIPFILLAVMTGSFLALLCVALFPSHKSKRIAFGLLILGGIFLFWKTQPELIREQGSLQGILSGYLPHVAMAKNIFLPSCWMTRGVLALCQLGQQTGHLWDDGLFYFQMLLANTLFMLLPTLAAGERLFQMTFLRSQDHSEGLKRLRGNSMAPVFRPLEQWKFLWKPGFGFFEKDMLTFRREPSEWSQMILFFGLLLIYFLNLRNFQAHVLKDMWRNIIFILNTVGTYIVLSSFSMRLIFPMISLEGSRAWMIALAPVSYASILMEKFILGTLLSMILTVPLVFLSGWMLEVSLDQLVVTTGMGFFVCIALTGLSVGFGALFPNFKSNNPSEIISGLGGSLLLFSHLTYLTFLGLFLTFFPGPLWISFLLMSTTSLLLGMLPLQLGVRHMSRMEF